MARREAIRIPYPGSVISVNHYQGRRRDGGTYIKPEAQAWMTELGWVAKLLHLDDWELPLHITCDGFFRNERAAPDLSNLAKCALDAIEEVCNHNDKDFRWHDGKRVIGVKEAPYLLLTISEQPPSSMPSKSVSRRLKIQRNS